MTNYSSPDLLLNNSSRDLLLQWNSHIVQKYVWITVILVILLLIGVFGNVVVVLVYKFKLTGKIEDRYFIPVLAVIDLVSCVLLISLSLTRTTSPVMFSDNVSCKCLNYFAHASSSASLFMLVVIAVHRYQKICKPLGYQMDELGKRVAIGIACGAAALLFTPLFSYYEVVPVTRHVGRENVTGYICATKKALEQQSASVIAWTIFTFIFYICTIVSICVLYTFVSKTILQKLAVSKQKKVKAHEKKRAKMSTSEKTDDIGPTIRKDSGVSYACDTLQLRRRKREGHFAMYRYSYIFMVITVKAIISYIGPWIIVIYESSKTGASVESLDLLILKRMYILSHVTNPVIYGLLDQKFRRELKDWITGANKRRYRVSGSGSS